jgi:hypothetical protein
MGLEVVVSSDSNNRLPRVHKFGVDGGLALNFFPASILSTFPQICEAHRNYLPER